MRDPFHGTWTIDTAESFVWDKELGRHVPDKVGQEIITLRIEDGIQDCEVLYGDRPQIRMGYRAAYDGSEWVPYVVREIISFSPEPREEVEEFKRRIKAVGDVNERQFEVGKCYGLVRLVYVDERTHYRFSRNPVDGKAQHVMLRRMAEDGNSYVARVFDVNGIVYRIRKFVRLD